MEIKDVLFNMKSELSILDFTLKALTESKIKTFGQKTFEAFKAKYGLACYYKKDEMDVLCKLSIRYDAKNRYGNTTEWVDVSCQSPEGAIEEIKKLIPHKLAAIEKAERTIKEQDEIIAALEKIIELKKKVSRHNYNSEMVSMIAYNMSDSFYLNNRI